MNTGHLTKTWQWRKQRSFHRTPEKDFLYEEAMKNEDLLLLKSASNPTITTTDLMADPSTVVRSATTGNFFNEKIIQKRRKQLRFSESVKVVLIPTADEYRKANFAEVLWWAPSSYEEFKRSALEEIKGAMRQHHSDVKGAMNIIYQPRGDDMISTAAAG
jgi:hypothetical protein